MTKAGIAGRLGLLALAFGISNAAFGQAEVTASQAMELSAFGAGTLTFTGVENTHNAGITAGVDLAFRPFFGVRPALEIRGTYPFDEGAVIGEKDGLVGIRLMKDYGRFHPYLTGMWGRGALTYVNGFIVGTYRYDRTTTNIWAGGGGIDLRVTDRFDIKADAQVQSWSTPVTTSGKLYPTPVSLGVVYRFDFNHHYKARKARPVLDTPPPPAAYIPPPVAAKPAPAITPATPPAPDTAPATTPAPQPPTGVSNPPPTF